MLTPLAPKKMCFIYRAQLMEVLLFLLAGNYVSPLILLCVVQITICVHVL